MDQKVTQQSFKTYRAWQKYVRKAHPKLSDRLVKSTLVSYCLSMAVDGTNGLGCYTSDAVIAEDLELYSYKLVGKYRREALRLGWFVWTGKKVGRSQVLDIAIPADDAMVTKARPADTKHDPMLGIGACPACKTYHARLSADEMQSPELTKIHFEACRLGVSGTQ